MADKNVLQEFLDSTGLAHLWAGIKPKIADAKKAGTDAQANLTTHTANKQNPHGVTAAQVGAVPTGRKVNGKALSADITLSASDVGADASGSASGVQGKLDSHTGNKSNPHGVTKSQVGLGNVPDVATNDQTPTYSAASTLETLTSGEKLSVSMGKIMKAITDLISHIGNKSNPHGVTAAQVGAAASGHGHDAGDITSGTLSSDRLPTVPIAKGGTGATTAANALYNLINGSSEITDPAKGDYLGIHDASGATGKKVTIETLFNNLSTMGLSSSVIKQGITGATEMAGTVANDADLMLIADASASNGVRNIKLSSLVTYFKNNGLAAESHTHTKSQITDFPSTENWTFTLEDGSTVTKAVYVG